VFHVLPARVHRTAGLLAAAALLAACGDFDNPAAAQGVSRNDLIAALAAQLGGSESLTYTATYQLVGGATGSIAHAPDPARTAYRYPGGVLVITTAAITRCVQRSCAITAPPGPAGRLPAPLFTAAQRTGLVPPGTVLAMLNAAALDTDLTVDQHDTTIAGRHATCVALDDVDDAAAREFSTCITNDGVLGSFTGTLGGKAFDVAMTDYADRIGADAFTAPAGSVTVDHR
jgi:hypothetical protein